MMRTEIRVDLEYSETNVKGLLHLSGTPVIAIPKADF
jgi:hypothetical protein